MSTEKVSVSYVCPSAAGFFFRLDDDKQTLLRFKHGALTLTDASTIKALDKLIEQNPVFKRRISKVDKVAAQALMNAHKAERHGVIRGGITAQSVLDSQKTPAGDAALDNLTVEQQKDLVDAIKEDSGLHITKPPSESKQAALVEIKNAKKVK